MYFFIKQVVPKTRAEAPVTNKFSICFNCLFALPAVILVILLLLFHLYVNFVAAFHFFSMTCNRGTAIESGPQ